MLEHLTWGLYNIVFIHSIIGMDALKRDKLAALGFLLCGPVGAILLWSLVGILYMKHLIDS